MLIIAPALRELPT